MKFWNLNTRKASGLWAACPVLLLLFGLSITVTGQNINTPITTQNVWEIRSQLIYQVIELPPIEKKEFVNIFNDYNIELTKLNDKKRILIYEYYTNYTSMTDEKADDFVKRHFDIKEDILKLNKKYHRTMKSKFGSITAARFLQTMNVIIYQFDSQFVGKLPLIE